MLQTKNETIDENLACRLTKQLADGLKEMRVLNWVHRDLKPGNLLLSCERLEDATLKIGDFGFATRLKSESLAQTWVGSPLYMAPEILTKESGGYDAKAGEPPLTLDFPISMLSKICGALGASCLRW